MAAGPVRYAMCFWVSTDFSLSFAMVHTSKTLISTSVIL